MQGRPLTQLPVWARVLLALAYLTALVVLGVFVVVRARGKEGFSTSIKRLNWPRACLFLSFATSWLFVMSSALGTVISSYTTSWDLCLYAQYTCILMYGASKVFLYLFLVEKVHLVWVSLNSHRRCKSRVYILCIACTIFYPPYVVCILAFKGFTADVHPDGHCYIGLRNFISIPIIVYDLYLNIMLTTLFVLPLWRRNIVNSVVRRIAHRSLIASVICLTASIVNILFIFLCHGTQPMWVCLGSCCLDIVVGAIAIFWTTTSREPRQSQPSDDKPAQSVLVFSSPARGAAPRPVALMDMSRAELRPIDEEMEEEGKKVVDEEMGVEDRKEAVSVRIVP